MYGAARHRGQVLTVQVLPSMLTELQESVSDVHLVNRAAAEYQSSMPGDIVCYSGHVGIYTGGGMMVHAPQPGESVKEVAVYGSPWYRRYW